MTAMESQAAASTFSSQQIVRKRLRLNRIVTALSVFATAAGLFVLACVIIVGFSFWAYPVNSLVGYGILALGVPPYLYWRAQSRRTAAAVPPTDS